MIQKIGVYIGRFAPFHNGHLHIIREAYTKYDKILIFVGSANRSPSPKTPWHVDTRIHLINTALQAYPRVEVISINDHPFDDRTWAAQMSWAVGTRAIPNVPTEVFLLGSYKDTATQRYLDYVVNTLSFTPDYAPVLSYFASGTEIRELLYFNMLHGKYHATDTLLTSLVPWSVYQYLEAYKKTPDFQMMKSWLEDISSQRMLYQAGAYEPIFVTMDAVVLDDHGCVLLICRGGKQGHGQWALPGGFVKPVLSLEDSIIEEVKEEADITVSGAAASFVVDTPDRSSRGRTITHVYTFYTDGQEPKGGDDASAAHFVNLKELPAETMWYEDHLFILREALRRRDLHMKNYRATSWGDLIALGVAVLLTISSTILFWIIFGPGEAP